jgi:hypothetical protein
LTVRREGGREVYKVKSKRGTQFRIWATNVLRDHLGKGYTLIEQNKVNQELKKMQALADEKATHVYCMGVS